MPRPPTPQERDLVATQLTTMRAELSLARQALGRPPRAEELEGPLSIPQGRALPSGLPDNPLRPAVAAVAERCPPSPRDDDAVDWIYCAEDGQIQAVGLPPYQVSGSE